MSAWDAGAGIIVLVGGVAVLVGSIAQAWGDLGKYQDFQKEIAAAGTGPQQPTAEAKPKDAPEIPAGVKSGATKARKSLPVKVFNNFVSKQISKVLSKEDVKKFLAKEDPGRFGKSRQVALLILIALWRPDQEVGEQHQRAEQALHDAAGWSLILLGSLLAVVAGVIQFVVLIVGNK
jgi:hypothetical protein